MNPRVRLSVLAGGLLLGFTMIVFRAFQLQILPTDNVARLARRQLSKRIEIVGRRGAITDRNGRELAVSMNTLSVFANPKLLTDSAAVARALAPVVGTPEPALRRKLADAADRKFVWLARQLNARQLAQLEKIDLKPLKGVGVLPEYRREYPQGQLAAHVLGFSSIDGDGMEGIERHFNERLRGERGAVTLHRDALGRPIFTHSEQIRLELNHGEDIELTIDSNLQHVAERALKEAIDEYAAQGGVALVLEPGTGEILALANSPAFDPNAPGASPAGQRRNRAITDPIEPGSVMKPFVVARAIEDRIVRPDSLISAGNGFIRVGNKTIGEAEANHRFKTISITDLIRLSSNVGTVTLQQKMGFARVEDTFRKLGFGEQLGIELGGESRGIFNSPKKNQLLEQATISFGQGIAVTPLQIASAYATLANGGHRVHPHIVRRLGGAAPPPAAPLPPSVPAQKAPEKIFSEATTAKMRVILEQVVEGEGTGTLARVESFPVAGKTGTAQKMDPRNGGYEAGAYVASFAGFVPARHPRFVIYAMIDHPSVKSYYGGAVAAPVFAKIARAALQLVAPAPSPANLKTPGLAQKPGKARVVAASLPARASAVSRVPELIGLPLMQALKLLHAHDLRVEVAGEGDHVVEQLPIAGARAEGSEKVLIKLR